MPSEVGKDVESTKPSYLAGESINWYFGKQFVTT